MNKLEEGWRNYAEGVLPGDAPEVQREAMKIAYWAGAIRATSLIVQGKATLEQLNDMAREHIAQCKRGEL